MLNVRDRFGPDRVIETPLSEQGFTNFATGAAIQWLRDGLGVISEAAETGPLLESLAARG